MKMIARILALALLVASCTGPAQTETPKGGSVQVNPTEINVDFEEQVVEVTVTADAQGKVTISGISKQLVGEFSAQIRKLRMPEPYKVKRIRYENEVIRRKVGKTGVK